MAQVESPPAIATRSPIDWQRVARLLLTSRVMDGIEERELVPAGQITYQFSAKGHELAQILLGLALDHPRDAASVYYRSRPFMLAAGLTVEEAFAAGMALTASPSEGRDVGVVFSMPPRSGPAVLPASGDVGAQYTPAAGWAQAVLYRQRVLGEGEWRGAVAAALGGDGSVAANGFWAALTAATTLRLPMLFFIEDNGYGISVPGHYQTPGGNIAANLAAFKNLLILEGDGSDPPEAAELIAAALQPVRAGDGPALLRLRVPRLMGHTFVDNQAYKTPEQIADEQSRDPLVRLRDYLADSDGWAALERVVEADVRAQLDRALAHPAPDPASATRHLFAGGWNADDADRPQISADSSRDNQRESAAHQRDQRSIPDGPRINLLDAVKRTLEVELERNPRVVVFGEDVGVKGGVHGATLGMQARFGAERVFDTSLSEEGIMGRAQGMALAGLVPVPEIQFRKYADPATEQINDTGTLRWRTAGKFAAPMVVRIPVGYGKKTGDPWHSVTGEAVYAHTLGWRLAFPSNAEDAVGLLRTALRGDDPTIFFEHRALLDTAPARRPYPGDDFAIPFGRAAMRKTGRFLTVVTWGEMVYRCLEAAEPFGDDVEVLDLRTIVPWDKTSVLDSVRKTGKCLIVHEDTITGGFGAEIMAIVSSQAFADLDAPLARLAVPDCPIPYSGVMMNAVIPSVEDIREEMRGLLEF